MISQFAPPTPSVPPSAMPIKPGIAVEGHLIITNYRRRQAFFT